MDKLNVDNTILLYAMRYALKRSIAAPNEFAKAVVENLNEIDSEYLKKMQDEIDKNMDSFDDPSRFIWQQVREIIVNERISRSKAKRI